MVYGDYDFIKKYTEAAEIFNQHYNIRLETRSNLKKLGHETRIGNGDPIDNKQGYTPNELFNGETPKGRGEERPHETMSHPD